MEKKHFLIGCGALLLGLFLFARRKDKIGDLEELGIEGCRISDIKRLLREGEMFEINGGEIQCTPAGFYYSERLCRILDYDNDEPSQDLKVLSEAIKVLRKLDKTIVINRGRMKYPVSPYASGNKQFEQAIRVFEDYIPESPYDRAYCQALSQIAHGSGLGLIWSTKKKDGTKGTNPGVKEYFGWGEKERRAYWNTLRCPRGQTPKTPEKWAESFIDYNDNDGGSEAMEGALDALRDYPTARAAMQQIVGMVGNMQTSFESEFAGRREGREWAKRHRYLTPFPSSFTPDYSQNYQNYRRDDDFPF